MTLRETPHGAAPSRNTAKVPSRITAKAPVRDLQDATRRYRHDAMAPRISKARLDRRTDRVALHEHTR